MADDLHEMMRATADRLGIDPDAATSEEETTFDPRLEELLDAVGERMRDEGTFESFVADNTVRLAALQAVSEWASAFPKVERGLRLVGPTGTGKTKLMVAAARGAAGTGARVWFREATDYFARLKRCIDRKTEMPRPDEWLGGYGLVCIDEIGAVEASPWKAEQMYLLVNGLWLRRTPMLVTTNLTMEEIAARWGERVASRLVDLTDGVDLVTDDWRTGQARKRRAK